MMEMVITKREAVQVKYLQVEAGVRYFEDGTVNGQADRNEPPAMPFVEGGVWRPVIDMDTGKIVDWPEGVTADVHYKVCDAGLYILLDESLREVYRIDGYVPDTLCPAGEGYGDYIIMKIASDGQIQNWSPDLSDFDSQDDD